MLLARHSAPRTGIALAPRTGTGIRTRIRSSCRIAVMVREEFGEAASRLVDIGRRFYARGWVLGTSGNFSAVVSRQPLRLAITASSVNKGQLRRADILQCDERGVVMGRGSLARRPSAETLLHVEIARLRGSGAVLHTHSVWTTVLSDLYAPDGGLSIEGYEMLKGLKDVRSHEHREWIPIIRNDQNMPRLAERVAETLDRVRDAHAFMLWRHGLYTWGDTLADAERHVEILEFLFEAVGRRGTMVNGEVHHGAGENS
jgi:methylthioribulose-1-phosphate dehydratase